MAKFVLTGLLITVLLLLLNEPITITQEDVTKFEQNQAPLKLTPSKVIPIAEIPSNTFDQQSTNQMAYSDISNINNTE